MWNIEKPLTKESQYQIVGEVKQNSEITFFTFNYFIGKAQSEIDEHHRFQEVSTELIAVNEKDLHAAAARVR